MSEPEPVTACTCAGIEEFIRCDTGGEYGSVGLVCAKCDRQFDVSEVTPVF